MVFWKKLFGKRSSDKPVAQTESLEEEIRRLSAIEAVDPVRWKEDYWRTLHPLVQAYWVSRVNREYEKDLPISEGDANSVFYLWGYDRVRRDDNWVKTARREELMRQYAHCKEELWKQAIEAGPRILHAESEVKKLAWQSYWEHYQTLSPQMQHLVVWELAKRGASRGRSGFHGGMGASLPFPFSTCGWASYEDPHWGNTEGVAFRVTRACFGDRKPLLFYLDDDRWPSEEEEKEYLAIIERYSSGIVNVRVEQRLCKSGNGEGAIQRVVLFELDPAAVKKTVTLSGKAVPAKELGEYVFVLPRCGEFYCVLGEVRDGEMIPLHKDDFCMK